MRGGGGASLILFASRNLCVCVGGGDKSADISFLSSALPGSFKIHQLDYTPVIVGLGVSMHYSISSCIVTFSLILFLFQ